MELVKKNNISFNEDTINEYALKLNLPKSLIKLLFCRGFDSLEKIDKFINIEKNEFYDPFLLKGMDSAVKRINSAIENNEKIVIYSDYDADGICSAAILSLYLKSQDCNSYTHIPDRITDGYGLNTDSLEKIIEEISPDLIITCDCGISGYNEVEYVLDLGVDIIVTDHHEIGERIPNCTVINPKQADCKYPFKELCGAGVALKLIQALAGIESSLQFVDIASIATVADLVPLLDENRLLVKLGLKKINEGSNLGIQRLIDILNISNITSTDIAFKIAPRINAAGRMGNASRAFDLLCTSDISKANSIVKEIDSDNERRKLTCDKIYNDAVKMLNQEKLYNRKSIVLVSDEWEKGITGIAAAKLASEFKRPSIILVKSADTYKGTARSVDGINIYEALSAVSCHLNDFGGHSGAAGFSISKENILAFKDDFESYISKFDDNYFLPYYYYDVSINESEIDKNLAECIEKLEPFGNSNVKPLFKISLESIKIAPCRSNSNHTQISTKNNFTIYSFNNLSKNQFLLGTGKKDLIIEIQSFNNIVNGILKQVHTDNLYIDDDLARANSLKTLSLQKYSKVEPIYYEENDLKDLVKGIYGNLFIAFTKKTYEKYINSKLNSVILIKEAINVSCKNNYNRLIVSPSLDSNLPLALYEKIIFLDSPISNNLIAYMKSKTEAEIYVPKKNNLTEFLSNIDLNHSTFKTYFELIMSNNNLTAPTIKEYFDKIKNNNKSLSLSQFVVCLTVLIDLGIFSIRGREFSLQFNQGVKSKLTDSKIYNYLSEIKQWI